MVVDDRIFVQAWPAEYGFSASMEDLSATDEDVDPHVEMDDWLPLDPPGSPAPVLAFVDGVERVEALAFVGEGTRPVPGLFGSVGVGAVVTGEGRARFECCSIERWGVFGGGAKPALPPFAAAVSYRVRSVHDTDPESLRRGLHDARGSLEADLARRLAHEGFLVLADGPLLVREPVDLVGYIKSHHKSYLSDGHAAVALGLRPGQRTPVFGFGRIRPRYSWYTRIAPAPGQHPWAALVRCEVSQSLGLQRASSLADRVTCHLPRFASRPFWDHRAPQNLVPIAALERKLRSLMGDRELVLRMIRSGVNRREAAGV